MKNMSFVIAIVVSIIAISIIALTSIDQYSSLSKLILNEENEIQEIRDKLGEGYTDIAKIKKELDAYTKNLEENNSKIQELKSGDEYHLYDPLYKDVVDFINKDDSMDSIESATNAKKHGLRCAYVEIIIAGSTIESFGDVQSGYMYTIIAFDTVDKGMIYFEPETDYQVYPKIGKKYSDCVEGNPYTTDIFTDDTITQILHIW